MKYYKTISGRYAPRKEIKKINNVYYHLDDLIKIKGRFNRIDNGKFIFNLDTGKWISSALAGEFQYKYLLTIINNTFIYAYSNEYSKIMSDSLNSVRFNSEMSAIIESYRYPRSSSVFSALRSGRGGSYNINLSYNFDGSTYQRSLLNTVTPTYNIFKKEFKEYLDKVFSIFKIGIELETSSGLLTDQELIDFNLVPLRDGSLQGGVEYCSPPISSSEQLGRLYDFFKVKLPINELCSTHFHFSGFPSKDEKFGLSMYYLCFRIQQELHDCIPSYRRAHNFLRRKDKDHARFLKSMGLEYNDSVQVKRDFPIIWDFLCGGQKVKMGQTHPKGNASKWNFPMRYFFINFLNYYFKKSETIEFRLFPGAPNYELLITWLLLCNILCIFAMEHSDLIFDNTQKINLKSIIEKSECPESVRNLLLLFIKTTAEQSYKEVIKNSMTFNSYAANVPRLTKILTPHFKDYIYEK